MSATIQNKNGITITQYASSEGIKVQVTWKSSDEKRFFDNVSFHNLYDATKFAELLEKRVVR